MRISRIYQAQSIVQGQVIELDQNASNYVAKVLRLSVGDNIHIFDGQGTEYLAKLSTVTKRQVSVTPIEPINTNVESPLHIHLGQVISRGEKMDYTIQKAVELGIHAITPLFSERCGVKLNPERLTKRMNHWQGIIISACEQSGRNILPTLHPAIDINQWQIQAAPLKLLLDPTATTNIKQLTTPKGPINLLVGPEGGLTNTEITQAKQNNFTPITLGPRILRTETAALCTLSILQNLYGDI